MNNDFYTYAYLRENGTPYYIGKGRKHRAFRKDRRKAGVPPADRILFLKTGLTEEEAFKHEIYMIALYGRKDLGTGILYNCTNGGEGCAGIKISEETKQKLSVAITLSHKKQSSDKRRKRAEKNSQSCRNWWNKATTEEKQERTEKMDQSAAIAAAAEWHKKPVEILFPDGRVGTYSSQKLAYTATGMDKVTLWKILKTGQKVVWGKCKGYSARYL